MKMMGLVAAAAVVAASAGCASSGSSGIASTSASHSKFVNDTAKISYVERVAKRRGVEVIWVNPPQKRVNDKGTP